MEVKIVLDEDEEVLVQYYAEVMGMSVEDAFRSAIMDKVRELYERQSESQAKYRVMVDDDEMPDDDLFNDEDR